MTDLGVKELERFRGAIGRGLGLHFDEAKFGFLAEVLRRRIEVTRLNADDYLCRLERIPTREEIGALGRELTVSETYFFRNIEQYQALRDAVLPELLAARSVERRLRILSLGCASGEEAYSLAILVRDAVPSPSWNVSVFGVDVNSTMIDKARRGRFSAWALRQTPDSDRRRWFRDDGRSFVLDSAIRASVTFEQRNLVEADPQFWQPGSSDVIFCRNVIMYFAPEQARAVVGRIACALSPGGYLFLGHAETLRGLSTDFHLRHTHGTFYYQRREPGQWPREARRVLSDAFAAGSGPLADAAAAADSWVDVIHRASARVAALAEARPAAQPGGGANQARVPAWDLGVVLELLRTERFSDALTMIDALPHESGRDPDVLLLRAVLLVHAGHFARAESACHQLLEVDDLSTGAHYLLALCREGAGDLAGAAYHDQAAAYLDPAFAMPRLHVGLAARRAGDWELARRELGQALMLLQREEASRILLFGGGFGRDALMALCRTELRRCGEERGW